MLHDSAARQVLTRLTSAVPEGIERVDLDGLELDAEVPNPAPFSSAESVAYVM